MKNDSCFNDLISDYRSLTPAEWQVFKDQVIRRAQQERTETIRRGLQALIAWLHDPVGRAIAAVFTGHHPVFPSRGTR